MNNRLARNAIVLAIAIFAILILVMTIRTYWINYRYSDGIGLPNQEIVGGDFLCFYVAGENAAKSIGSLYDFEQAQIRQEQIISGRNVRSGLLPFAYPPLLALLFSQFSKLSFQQAYLSWLAFSAFLAALSIFMVLHWMRISKTMKLFFFICAMAFVPYSVNCLGGGQTSCLGLFAFSLIFFLLKSKRDFWAGIALALSYYKPPIFLVFLLFIILHRRWKMISGFLLMASFLIVGSILMLGLNGFIGYLQTVSRYTYGQEIMKGVTLPPSLGVGLYALFTTTLKDTHIFSNVLFLLVSGGLVFATYRIAIRGKSERREEQSFDFLFSVEVILSALLSLQLLYYDLTVLLVPMVIVGSWLWISRISWINVLLLSAIVGLYVEFLFRESLLHYIPIKGATAAISFLVVALLLSLSRISKDYSDRRAVVSQ